MMPRPLFRLLGALARGLLILIRRLAMWLLRQILMFIRFALPHMIRVLLMGLWWALRLMALSVIAMFRGLGVVNQIAEHWLGEALATGFPPIWERELRITFQVLAVIAILAGWTILLLSGYIAADWGYSLIFHR